MLKRSIVPQLFVVGSPSPRKLRAFSTTIASPTLKTARAIIKGAMFGSAASKILALEIPSLMLPLYKACSLSTRFGISRVLHGRPSGYHDSQVAGQLLLDNYELREDLLRRVVEESIQEQARRLASGVTIEISSDDLTITIGGVTGFNDEKEFEQRYKERYRISKVYELLVDCD